MPRLFSSHRSLAAASIILALSLASGSVRAQSTTMPAGFVQTDSGCLPDGGLCLVPPAHYSEQVEVSLSVGARQIGLHPNVIYGTGRAEVIAPDGRVLLAVSDSLLHGHEAFNPKRPTPYFNYRDGVFRDRHKRFQSVCQAAGFQRTACLTKVTYRYATSDTRWERRVQAERGTRLDTLDVSWWDVVPDAEADYQPILAHILNVARLRRAKVVRFPECGDYGYYGSVALPDIELVGAGGTEVVDAQTTVQTPDGAVTLDYRPVRAVACPTRLLALPQTAHYGLFYRLPKEDSRRRQAEARMPADAQAKLALRSWATAFYPQSGVERVALRDLILDGNLETQLPDAEVLAQDQKGRDVLEEHQRNAPFWSGLTSQGHGGVEIPRGQRITLERVGIVGFSASTIGTEANFWTMDTVLLGGNTRNHAAYCTNGEWDNVTLTSFSWSFVEVCPKDHFTDRTTATNLVVERAEPNPTYWPDYTVVNFRGGRLLLDGFFFDLRGSDLADSFEGVTDTLLIRNGTILGGEKIGNLWRGYDNGRYKGKHSRLVKIEDVQVYLGGAMGGLVDLGRHDDVRLRDIDVRAGARVGAEPVELARLARIEAQHPARKPVLRVFDRVRVHVPMSRLATVYLPDALPEAATNERIASMRSAGFGAAAAVVLQDVQLTSRRVEQVQGERDPLLQQLVRVCADPNLTRAMSARERSWLGSEALCDRVERHIATSSP